MKEKCSIDTCNGIVDNRSKRFRLCRIHLENYFKDLKNNNFDIEDGCWKRNCPNPMNNINCSKILKYTKSRGFQEAILNNSLCTSCATLSSVRTEDWCKNISQSKQGLKLTDSGLKKLYETKLRTRLNSITIDDLKSNYKIYQREVWYWTNKNDIKSMINYNKRGRSGIPGAFQLDHIISIHYGFINNIDPRNIGSPINLWFVPWEINLRKSNPNNWMEDFSQYYPSQQYYSNIFHKLSHVMFNEWKVPLTKLKRIENGN